MRLPHTISMAAGTGALTLLLADAPILAYAGDDEQRDVHVVMLSDDDATGTVTLVGDEADGIAHRVIMIGDEVATGEDEFVFAGDHDVHTINAHSIEVRIVNGEPTVTVDGKEVPAPRVVHEDGKIIVLDENGDEIRTIQVGPMTGNRTFGFHAGEGNKRVWFGDAARSLLPEPKVMLGVQLGTPSRALEHHLALDPDTTTIITALYEGLPAHAAGIEEHDIVTSIDGGGPADPATLRETLSTLEPGDTVRLGVISAGAPKTVRVKVAAYDRDAMSSAKVIGDTRGTALFGPNVFGRQIEVPGDQSLFELDFGKVEDLNRFFLDDSNRLFEMPKGRMRLELKDEEGETTQEVEVELDSRLSTLDKRLAALEEMLDALLKEAKKGGR